MASTLAVQFSIAQQYMGWFMIVYVVFGNIGNLFNCLVFLRKKFRSNSCSCYLLVGSIANMIVLTLVTTFVFYPLQKYDPTNYSTEYCRFRSYIGHASMNVSRALIVIACFDRACVSSSKVWMRNLGKAKIAWKIIFVCIMACLAIAFHALVWNYVVNGRCIRTYLYNLIFSIYTLVLISTTPLVLMIIFSAMTLHNIKVAHNRIQPLSRSTGMRQRDFQLTRMLVAEVLVYVISTSPFPIQLFYAAVTMSVSKSDDRLAIEAFTNYVATAFLVYINPSVTFYVYYATSKTFRVEFKQTLKHIYNRFFRRLEPQQNVIDTRRTGVHEVW